MRIARYGWIPEFPDHRDLPRMMSHVSTPSSVDLSPLFPDVWDQGPVGSCTGHACAAALAYARGTEDLSPFTPSRLMLYYNARRLEGTTAMDVGAQIRDVIKGAAMFGACPEDQWPYDLSKLTTEPSIEAYAAATKDRAVGYHSVPQGLDSFRSCLADGDPIVFGFSVFESFESDQVARDGMVPMPAKTEALVGGHASVITGYNDDIERLKCRNSWNKKWGDNGSFYLPYAYLTDPGLASDFWTIQLVTAPEPITR